MAARLSFGFLFPMFRSAQFTAFITKFLSSVAARSMTGNRARNRLSGAALSCHARPAISANDARFTNSSSLCAHSRIFFQTSDVFSKRFMHTPSQTSHESKSTTHVSICLSVTCRGSSIIAAT
jgi:hypothetical protein